jgi:hypothetical protein
LDGEGGKRVPQDFRDQREDAVIRGSFAAWERMLFAKDHMHRRLNRG